jgi:hypothetical protein
LTAFWNYWKEHYRNIVVRKPSRDICGICYEFCLGNKKACARIAGRDNPNSDDHDSDDDDIDGTESEQQDIESL